jgi:hypothetical protein
MTVLTELAQQAEQLGLLGQLAPQVVQEEQVVQEVREVRVLLALTELVDTEEAAQPQVVQAERKQVYPDIFIMPTQEVLAPITGGITAVQVTPELPEATVLVTSELVALRAIAEQQEIPERVATLARQAIPVRLEMQETLVPTA